MTQAEDKPFEGDIESLNTADEDFFVAMDATTAQYLRTTDAMTGYGFAFSVIDYDKNDELVTKVIRVVLADPSVLPTLLKEMILTVSCQELQDELLAVLNNHNHDH